MHITSMRYFGAALIIPEDDAADCYLTEGQEDGFRADRASELHGFLYAQPYGAAGVIFIINPRVLKVSASYLFSQVFTFKVAED